jgi:hypothetical protein
MFTRRRFLQASSALLAGCAAQPRFASDPFKLGVASGYPAPDGFVLWTRLVGAQEPVRVRWEIFADDALRKVVASGDATAEAEWAHSVHEEAKGLEPGRPYWYRFTAGDAQSPVGRTRTAPMAASTPERLRFAFASCQQYEQGYYGAYRHMVADELDLAVFLGDYIYESSWGRDHVRKHDAPEPYTLADYRGRYQLYKSDPDLQAAHAAMPWIVTWDDHEVDNDYADDRPEDELLRPRLLLLRDPDREEVDAHHGYLSPARRSASPSATAAAAEAFATSAGSNRLTASCEPGTTRGHDRARPHELQRLQVRTRALRRGLGRGSVHRPGLRAARDADERPAAGGVLRQGHRIRRDAHLPALVADPARLGHLHAA